MKVFSSSQIRKIDSYTIENEPINSIDLMERAAFELFKRIVQLQNSSKPIFIFSGPGNNGGDGAAISRMLAEVGYNVNFFLLASEKYSPDLLINVERLKKIGINPISIKSGDDFPNLEGNEVIIDSLFGSGLSKPLGGVAEELVTHINKSLCTVFSIDSPSGLFGEENPFPNTHQVVRANVTLTLQFPKLSFFFSENSGFVGNWQIVDIGLHPQAIAQTETPFSYIDFDYVQKILKTRGKFQHKGAFGRCLIIAGSYGMLGASVLCTKACLRSGSGLVHVHLPTQGVPVMQTAVPEAIVQTDENGWYFTGIDDCSGFDAVAIGPGIGQESHTQMGLFRLLSIAKVPLVIDADGLNILAQYPEMLNHLPANSILTPHVGEFDRMFGKSQCDYDRLMLAIKKANELNVIIIIKGAHTRIFCPDGKVFFNSTGNPGMATAGSGDVLTGIITSLAGQGYSPVEAAISGVFIHGLAGDLAAQAKGHASLLASDIIDFMDQAFLCLAK